VKTARAVVPYLKHLERQFWPTEKKEKEEEEEA